MPFYSYKCTNSTCKISFALSLDADLVDDLHFCPECASIADRDYSDLKSISTSRITPLPSPLPKGQEDNSHHVHSATCGCALSKDWESVAEGLTPDDMKRS